MNKLFQFLFLAQNLMFVITSNVILMKNEFLSTPNSTQFKLNCKFHLEHDKTVKRVDISKNGHTFFSVEYNVDDNKGHSNHVNSHGLFPHTQETTKEVTNFKKVSGIQELEKSDTHFDSLRNEGWAFILIKRVNYKPIPGTYRCKVYYMEGLKKKDIESDKVFVEDKKGNFDPVPVPRTQSIIHSIPEKVEFEINHGHERFHKGKNIKMECKYTLLKQDKFAGLSLTKDNREFFSFYNNKNHSFLKVPGIDKVSWSSYAKKIFLTIKKAQNITAGNYACKFNFSNPTSEEKVITLSDAARIVYKSSTDNKLAKSWILLLLFMVYVIY